MSDSPFAPPSATEPNSHAPSTFAHFLGRNGIEVDLVIERADGSVVAVEVKWSSSADRADGKGLRFLRDALGDRFHCGVVFHTGPLPARLDDRIWATPIPALWGGGGVVPGYTGLGSDRNDRRPVGRQRQRRATKRR